MIRNWLFTAALWDEDEKPLLGRLHPHPLAKKPANARFQVRGNVDEVQAFIEANSNQTVDIFQAIGGDSKAHLTVNDSGMF